MTPVSPAIMEPVCRPVRTLRSSRVIHDKLFIITSMNKSEQMNRRQFLNNLSRTFLCASTAVIIPSLQSKGIWKFVQDSSRSSLTETDTMWTPTPIPSAEYPGLSTDEIKFIADHELIHGDTTRKVAMITYDDARTNDRLNHLMDVYRENGVKMTVFIIGTDMDTCKEALPRLIAEGHDLGCHGWTHDSPMTSLRDQDLDAQFGKFQYKLETIIPGYRIRFFRAPFGDRNQRVRDVAARWGMQHVLWSLESGGQDKQTYHNVIDRLQPGEIILSHETRYFDVNDADVIVRELIRKGYSLENLRTGMASSDRWEDQ